MNTLVQRLRGGVYGVNRIPLCHEAADRIEQLEHEVFHLKRALVWWFAAYAIVTGSWLMLYAAK